MRLQQTPYASTMKYVMNDYDNRTALYYDSLVTETGDIDFYLCEARKTPGPVLELGCGTGRVLVAIANAGIEVYGLDISESMLQIARTKFSRTNSGEAGSVVLLRADMRQFKIAERFSLVIIPFRSFQYLLNPSDQRMALDCIHRHMKNGGKLIFNICQPKAREFASDLAPDRSPMKLLARVPLPGGKTILRVWNSQSISPDEQRIEYELRFEEMSPDGRLICRHNMFSQMRYTGRYEMEHLLELAGFKVEKLYGGFNKERYQYGREMVFIAEKKGN